MQSSMAITIIKSVNKRCVGNTLYTFGLVQLLLIRCT